MSMSAKVHSQHPPAATDPLSFISCQLGSLILIHCTHTHNTHTHTIAIAIAILHCLLHRQLAMQTENGPW